MRYIAIRGARCHNLKNITVSIPRGKLIVVTGISGSGKSSLIFDTLFTEGERRYLESLSGSANHFLKLRERSDVDSILGLTPTIAVSQTFTGDNPRSTVGTVSEIYDYLRLLFVRVGLIACSHCGAILPVGETVCASCGASLQKITPRSLSFNNPLGACPVCEGLGIRLEVDPDLVVPNKRLSIMEGAIKPLMRFGSERSRLWKALIEFSRARSIDVIKPIGSIPDAALRAILHGAPPDFEGVIPHLEKRYRETESGYARAEVERYMRERPCPDCMGSRLNKQARSVILNNVSLDALVAKSIEDARGFFDSLALDPAYRLRPTRMLIQPIRERLSCIERAGLSYLTLNRAVTTLGGGEVQRLRIAMQIGLALSGVTYILDEPTMGLHARNTRDLIQIMKDLSRLDNTVIVIEHDRSVIEAADYVIDMGPGAGELGGRVMYAGHPDGLINGNAQGETARYIKRARVKNEPVYRRRAGNGKFLTVIGAREHNLQSIDVSFPLGVLIGITGVSGSGKSTLVHDILARALLQELYRAKRAPGAHKEIIGINHVNKAIIVDQSPIGRTPRSNPATFIGAFAHIRDFFASLPEAKKRRYEKGHFSFNVPGGRCETCSGEGEIKIEMYFLPDMYAPCPDCRGTRYSREVLEIKWREKTIADILSMTPGEALAFLGDDAPKIRKHLITLSDVGLDYIKLGQPATTLSGGEAQRVKLAAELSRHGTGSTMYILDEPTVGLHFKDTEHLMRILNALVDKGNTVIIIEHNIDVISVCDWLIDMGPEGGSRGGRVVAHGTPEDVARVPESYTGEFLKEVL